MAMKMTAVEKQNDSIIRAYNSQIEKAVKQLGYGHTVTQNLINNATMIFGENNMKQMTKKYLKIYVLRLKQSPKRRLRLYPLLPCRLLILSQLLQTSRLQPIVPGYCQ